MSWLLSFGLLAAGQVGAPPPASAVPPVAVTADTERMRLAVELAEALNSEPLIRTQIAKMLNETMPASFAQNPDMASLERAYPGTIAAVIDAMRPLMTDHMISVLPAMWRDVAPEYANALTAAELRQLLAFYRGPVGVRIGAIMAQGIDYSAGLNRIIANDDATLNVSDIQDGTRRGVARLVRDASAEDMAAMNALVTTSAGRKLPAITIAVNKRIAAWAARPTPELDARIEKAVDAAMVAHIAKSTKP